MNSQLFHLFIQIAEDYSHCDILLRLPGYTPSKLKFNSCSPFYFLKKLKAQFPAIIENRMVFLSVVPAFRDVIDVPLVVRGLRKSRSEVCVLLLEYRYSKRLDKFLVP